ncbi:MAG: methyltransferase domain-containing protein [Planctomycetaceae bacterium]|nr:methyltransferase domain-containing protein [Planctomycetaceae bacterium]
MIQHDTVTPEQVEAGQAVYTERLLKWYDFIVLQVSNRWIWKCPTTKLLAWYNQHVTANHLDVGVGSGYFPDHCMFPADSPRVALMDLNQTALDYAAKRIARYAPATYQRNVLEPVAFPDEKFDSIAVNYLLHCVPGTMVSKAVVFDSLKPLLNPGGVLFGATLLQGGVKRGLLARCLMSHYNRKGIFCNEQDNLADLEAALKDRFQDVTIEIVGAVALFSGRA